MNRSFWMGRKVKVCPTWVVTKASPQQKRIIVTKQIGRPILWTPVSLFLQSILLLPSGPMNTMATGWRRLCLGTEAWTPLTKASLAIATTLQSSGSSGQHWVSNMAPFSRVFRQLRGGLVTVHSYSLWILCRWWVTLAALNFCFCL